VVDGGGCDGVVTGFERVPHIGWNEVDVDERHPAAALFAGIPPRADFYFVHSFHVACRDPRDVLATTPYCGGFVAAVARGNVVATQFHPEKSQQHGLRLLRNFLELSC
jgi:glutamine amidotransferase